MMVYLDFHSLFVEVLNFGIMEFVRCIMVHYDGKPPCIIVCEFFIIICFLLLAICSCMLFDSSNGYGLSRWSIPKAKYQSKPYFECSLPFGHSILYVDG